MRISPREIASSRRLECVGGQSLSKIETVNVPIWFELSVVSLPGTNVLGSESSVLQVKEIRRLRGYRPGTTGSGVDCLLH